MAIKTYITRGLARWAKVVGPAPAGYDNGPPEWSVDLVLDEQEQKKYLSYGGDKFYLKTNKEGETFIKFSRKADKKDGSKTQPIDIVDHKNTPWDTKLIGNDSVLNVCYALNTVKSKGVQRMKPYILSIQVWDLVTYKPKGPFSAREDTGEDSSVEVHKEEW